jgi:pyruvate/2-oxoglutarate/acetoin dehydrogenase E1 component
LCKDPVVYIDDRWLYEQTDTLGAVNELDLRKIGPKVLVSGSDLTIVASGYSTLLALKARDILSEVGINAEVIDLRVINPFNPEEIIGSVKKTGHLLVIDGGWRTCGLSSEVIASVIEQIKPSELIAAPVRVTIPDAPAPTSRVLEKIYYPDVSSVVESAKKFLALNKEKS